MNDIEVIKKLIVEKEAYSEKILSEVHELRQQLEKLILKQQAYETNFNILIGQPINEITLIIEQNEKIWFDKFFYPTVNENAHISAYEHWDMSHTGYCWFDDLQSYALDACTCERVPVKIIGYVDLVLGKTK